jgi:hypothetical protein
VGLWGERRREVSLSTACTSETQHAVVIECGEIIYVVGIRPFSRVVRLEVSDNLTNVEGSEDSLVPFHGF